MKQTEKMTRILFVSNILYIIGFFIIPFEPKLFFETTNANGINPFVGVLNILAILTFAHWIYCLWFLSKYDRYSGSLIWLILLNGIYAPIYYYQVFIKKRPLKNEILNSQEFVERERKNEIEEYEYADLMRDGLIELLELWGSKEKQIELQKSNSEINITEELFSQWKDYNINKPELANEIFKLEERIAIKQFDKIINEKNELFFKNYPKLKDFIGSESWNEISNLAKETLKKIKNTVSSL